MPLAPLDFLNGLLSLLTVITSLIVGILIVSKYFKYEKKTFLYLGIAWIGAYQPWWPAAISFISILVTEQGLTAPFYIIIGSLFIPIFLISFILGVTEMIMEGRRNQLLIIYSIIMIIAEILIIYYLVTDYTRIGILARDFDMEYERIMSAYLLFINLTIVIMGILFSRQSLRSDIPDVRLKGKILITAFVAYFIGAFLDAGIFSLTATTLIIARIILITGSILFYVGFILPDFIKKFLGLDKT